MSFGRDTIRINDALKWEHWGSCTLLIKESQNLLSSTVAECWAVPGADIQWPAGCDHCLHAHPKLPQLSPVEERSPVQAVTALCLACGRQGGRVCTRGTRTCPGNGAERRTPGASRSATVGIWHDQSFHIREVILITQLEGLACVLCSLCEQEILFLQYTVFVIL